MRFRFKKQHFGVVTVCQRAMSYSDGDQRAALMKKCESLWRELDKLLGSLPVRSSVVLTGDFNIALDVRSEVAGSGIHRGRDKDEIAADRRPLMDILIAFVRSIPGEQRPLRISAPRVPHKYTTSAAGRQLRMELPNSAVRWIPL